jgi:hypothetical protein
MQGPVRKARLPGLDALVGPGQTVLDQRTQDDGTEVIELSYEHDSEPWWQGHWVVAYGTERLLIITAQACSAYQAQTRDVAQSLASTLE